MKEVALITIHGMGKVKLKYYEGLEDKLKKSLGDEYWKRIAFENVQYAEILQEPQDALWKAMKKSNKLDYTKLREFFLFGFGDAGSLEYSAYHDKVKYIAVQKKIQETLEKTYKDLGKDKTKPVIIIAQSLGCQVISNYLWDAEKKKYIFTKGNDDPDKQEFFELKSLTNLITTGCNIPLCISGLSNRERFKKPNDNFEWDNYYDRDDALGWPLEQLYTTPGKIVTDHEINAGGLLTSWNPFSHTQYWEDKDVIRPLTKKLLKLLK